MAGLPAVATQVGDCPEVLDHGQAGLLVAPRRPDELAAALLRLLRSAELRASLGEALRCRVQEHYTAEAVMRQVCSVYDSVLEEHAFATAG
jgi:glycosyltransferase involved in cell wall biosynthesis